MACVFLLVRVVVGVGIGSTASVIPSAVVVTLRGVSMRSISDLGRGSGMVDLAIGSRDFVRVVRHGYGWYPCRQILMFPKFRK